MLHHLAGATIQIANLVNDKCHSQEEWQQEDGNHTVCACMLDWLQSLKQFFINVSYHILVASLTLMALF